MTAVQAATLGSSVRWFVVGNNKNKMDISQTTLDSIAQAGGSLEVAGSDVDSCLLDASDSQSSLPALDAWSNQNMDALVCTLDGTESTPSKKKADPKDDPILMWKNAIKVAARQAAQNIPGTKIAILSADEDDGDDDSDESEGGGLGNLVGSLFGSKLSIPSSLDSAMGTTLKVRHGQIFGIPESSPDFSALVGGPKLQPDLCEEYSMRTIRVDPTLSVSGNRMMGTTTRSSRLAVGEAAALMSMNKVPTKDGLDVCVSSQLGTDPPSLDDWTVEFERVLSRLESGQAAQLFEYEFASVPDTERLTDWLTTKWAPAVLRTYDIAAIRTGARPVFAVNIGNDTLEIVWQELVNFETLTVGKMLIQVKENGLVATRVAGDATKGYGSVSTKPLAGEDILVRRLAEAATQAIEKGLAKKPRKTEPVKEVVMAAAAPISSIASSGSVESAPTVIESGPRQAGARRSPERKRRKTSHKSPPSST